MMKTELIQRGFTDSRKERHGKFVLIEEKHNGEVVKSYTYDKNGRKIKEEIIPNKSCIEYEYNADGNLIREKYPNDCYTDYIYDEHGNLLKKESAGWCKVYSYDINGNKIKTLTYCGGNLEKEVVYDEKGNVLKLQVGDQCYEYEYDADGKMQLFKTSTMIKRYIYNTNGTLKSIVHDDNNCAINYLYDDRENLITISLVNPDNGSVSRVTNTFTYDNNDRLVREEHYSGLITLYKYRSDGTLWKKTIYDNYKLDKYLYDIYMVI